MARKDPETEQVVDIFVYSMKHGGGICYLYENQTRNKSLDEVLKFKLSGLKIVGVNGSEVNIQIGPGESKFIELKATSSQWRIQTAVSYGIY